MGQFERWVVGIVITLFAYRFMEDSSQRIYFHKLATEVLCTPAFIQLALNYPNATASYRASESVCRLS